MKRYAMTAVLCLAIAVGIGIWQRDDDPFAAVAAGDIVLYSAQWCVACHEVKYYLKIRGVPFEVRDIETQPEAKAALDALGGKGIPQLVVGGQPLPPGFDAQILQAAVQALKTNS